MAEHSKIEWTQATWNPTAGCSVYSPGCVNCYAMRQAGRLEAMGQAKYAGLTQVVNGNTVWTGKVRLWPQDLRKPLDVKKPTTWFVDSMSDLFHEDLSDEDIDRVFAVMALARQHTFQVLTKRADRMRQYLTHPHAGYRVGNLAFVEALRGLVPTPADAEAYRRSVWPLPNVWLGVSVENQGAADQRIPHLAQTPAAVRFLSCEPLLGRVDLMEWLPIQRVTEGTGRSWIMKEWTDVRTYYQRRKWELTAHGIPEPELPFHWVIAGGESGPDARPCHPGWARELRDQCQAAGVRFFWKQWGAWKPISEMTEAESEALYLPPPARDPEGACKCKVETRTLDFHGGKTYQLLDGHCGYLMFRVGKHRAGRTLDGRTWDEMPDEDPLAHLSPEQREAGSRRVLAALYPEVVRG